jgi:hypothetical protein
MSEASRRSGPRSPTVPGRIASQRTCRWASPPRTTLPSRTFPQRPCQGHADCSSITPCQRTPKYRCRTPATASDHVPACQSRRPGCTATRRARTETRNRSECGTRRRFRIQGRSGTDGSASTRPRQATGSLAVRALQDRCFRPSSRCRQNTTCDTCPPCIPRRGTAPRPPDHTRERSRSASCSSARRRPCSSCCRLPRPRWAPAEQSRALRPGCAPTVVRGWNTEPRRLLPADRSR